MSAPATAHTSTQIPPATVLIVDDSQAQLDVLKEQLWQFGLRVRVAHDGEEALRLAERLQPDLILLDVLMPGIDGFETCRRLKANRSTAEIPVIFMTSLQQTEDKLTAFDVGGVDYITKPIHPAEVAARIGTHIALRAARRALEHEVQTRRVTESVLLESERRLRERTAEAGAAVEKLLRSEQLLLSEKLAAAGQLTAGVAHEISNPAHFARASAQQLADELAQFHEFLRRLAGPEADPEILENIAARIQRLHEPLQIILDGTERIAGIVQDLRMFARMDPGAGSRMPLVDALKSTLNLVRAKYKHDIRFATDFAVDPPVACLPARINQVFMNLIINACQAVHERARRAGPNFQGEVRLATAQDGHWLKISVEDNGCGMEADVLARIYEPFFTTKPPGEGTGLGLSLSYGIIQDHGGAIDVASVPDQGTRFVIRLPL